MHNPPTRLNDVAIDIIKYSILVSVKLSTLSSHFVTRYSEPIFPPSISLRSLHVNYACNIKRALHSHQQRPSGRSKYRPLPEQYNPYHFILPKIGSEHIILPPFTHAIWKSQFSRNLHNDSATMNRANLSSSINPANRPRPSLVHQFLGSMSPRSRSVHHIASATTATRTSDEQPFNVLAPIKPRIMSCGREVDGIPCAYHVMVSFNDSDTAYVGYGFNIFARYVSNAITLKGYMHDALLVGTAHSLPFNNGLPFKELAFFGSGNKIFVPMVCGMEIAMIEEIAQHMSARWRVTGKQNEQLLASFHVVREHLAPYALHHGMIAIEFDNIPNNYNLNKDSGRFQDPVTLEQQPNALTCHMKSKSFELRDTDLPTNENTFIFNQTSFTYVLPLDSPATKVSTRLRKWIWYLLRSCSAHILILGTSLFFTKGCIKVCSRHF